MTPLSKPVVLDLQRIQRIGGSDQHLQIVDKHGIAHAVPIHHISQLQVRQPRSGILAAMLKLATRGRPVFIVDGHGRLLAQLTTPERQQAAVPWVDDLRSTIIGTDAQGYAEWVAIQQAHACSRVFRGRGKRAGDYQRCLSALERLCRRRETRREFQSAYWQLQTALHAFVERLVLREGLLPLQFCLLDYGHDLRRDLCSFLVLPMLGNHLRLLREEASVSDLRIARHFEAMTPQLQSRAILHLRALHHWLRRARDDSSADTRLPRATFDDFETPLRAAP
jgi:hypothetical protein